MAKHGSIDSSLLTEKGRRSTVRGRLFSFGDSLSTIRKPDSANTSVNGRFSTNGYNWCDYFRFGFSPFLELDTSTSWAYEGAYATNDITGQSWSTIQPIPSFNSQINFFAAAYPLAGSVNSNDVCAVYFGTNDSSNYATVSPAPTVATFNTAIKNGLNRLLGYGFKNFVILFPESRYFAGAVPAALQPDIDALQAANRDCKIITVTPSSAVLEFTSPYISDGTHYVPLVYERLGEIAIAQFLNQSWIDKTQNVYFSAKGATPASPRELGFSNFDPNTNGTRFVLADQFNCFEAVGNQRLTLRSYNGLVVNGAFEANGANSGTGAGKNDPCMMIQGNFWEHSAILRLDAVTGVPATQSPLILGRTGGTEVFKLGSDGVVKTGQWNASAIPITSGGSGGNSLATARTNLGISTSNRPNCYAIRLTTNQSIPHSAWTTLLYNSKTNDVNNIYNASTGVITIPTGGDDLYGVNAGFLLDANAMTLGLGIWKAGVEIARLFTNQSSTDTGNGGAGFATINLVAGDAFTIQLIQINSTSAARNFTPNASLSYLSVFRLNVKQ